MDASPLRSVLSRIGDVAALATSPLTPAHYLRLVRPVSTATAIQARIVSVWDETADARTLTLRPGSVWRAHRPGQFIRVSAVIDGRIVTRTYSLSSSPDRLDGCITITVTAIPGGKMSGFLVRRARVGEYLTLGLPQGDFVLPGALPPRVLYVTAGSGITPVMSMLQTLALRGWLRDVEHVHYAPTGRDAIFGTELARIASQHPGYRLHLVTTDTMGAVMDTARLDALVADWRSRETWACGPEGFLGALEDAFSPSSTNDHLHLERFRPRLVVDPKATGGRVRFALSRAELEADGQTPLLELAERNGLRAASGCRMGICHSCDVTMVSGCVRDLRTGQRIDEPGTRVQVCVCAAAGDVEIAL